MRKPKGWPEDSTYVDHYQWHKDVPIELKMKFIGTMPQIQMPFSHYVKIQKITDPNHPVFGQNGLFAAKTIPPETYLFDYIGLITEEDKSSEDSGYMLQYGPGLICDAEKFGNEARMVNDYHNIAESPNVSWKTWYNEKGEKRVGIWTTKKKIKKGDEILINYGRGFNKR